ncbi:acyl-CoA dehydrogenase domain-containing protein [Desulfurispirillum indicum S5]|uniref:Acyl-CoA dehydrogenase domain-containing protein n=1 Tax=Desulfurispirillum indicum (strain ATCC BAA-1389 / DSM 22839 / S5) TaxID=653733 RepID=E6W6A6_DESIS|nr:acyl-CoA dehydrogenase family protein [Desulfurispirillum indicum]ADU66142.1 acyl-CoA dehydrogenase domain-containing protein [Desulfurispirillum indicum S5]
MARIFKGGEYLITEMDPADIFTPEDFTDEQRQIADTTQQFVTNDVIPHIDEIEQQNFDLVVELMGKAGELGLLMTDASEEEGGLELDKATSMLVAEKIAPAGSFSVAFAAHTGIGTLPLIYYGTAEQKERYLSRIITGEWMSAYCLTEPGSGSDALGAQATAVLSEDGKYYILNGTKQFITNGGFAQLFTVFAKIDKEHFTAFLVEKDFEGLEIGAEEKKLGIKGSSTTQVILNNCRIPVENLLGEIGKGHKIAFNVLNVGRFKLGAAVSGAAKMALQEGIKYANERKQFGRPISSFGAISEKIANMTADIFAAESLIYRLAGLLDNKLATIEKGIDNYYEEYQKGIEEYAPECGIAKVFCSEVLARTVDEVLQIHGGYGFVSEYPAERFYRDERINRIFEGTNEINRLLVPGMILRKAMKGELPLQSEAMKAFEQLMTPSFEELDENDPFAREKQLVKNLKNLFLILSGAAVQKYMDKLQDEQEILLAAADLCIQIFALESVLKRVEKAQSSQISAQKKELMAATLKICAFSACEAAGAAAQRGAFYAEEGDTLTMILSGIRRFAKYDATGLLQAKRALAATAIEQEKYIF